MKQLASIVFILFNALTVHSVMAQSEPDPAGAGNTKESLLRIGYSPVNFTQKDSPGIDINLEWELPLSPNWTFSANLYRDFSNPEGFSPDIYKGARDFFTREIVLGEGHDIRTSLSLGLNYYFKPGVYEGFYGALKVTNVLTHSNEVFFEEGHQVFVNEDEVGSLPEAGLYLGYRKVFRNNFFVDASAGYLIRPEYRNIQDYSWRSLDLKITLGYQIKPSRKKK